MLNLFPWKKKGLTSSYSCVDLNWNNFTTWIETTQIWRETCLLYWTGRSWAVLFFVSRWWTWKRENEGRREWGEGSGGERRQQHVINEAWRVAYDFNVLFWDHRGKAFIRFGVMRRKKMLAVSDGCLTLSRRLVYTSLKEHGNLNFLSNCGFQRKKMASWTVTVILIKPNTWNIYEFIANGHCWWKHTLLWYPPIQ